MVHVSSSSIVVITILNPENLDRFLGSPDFISSLGSQTELFILHHHADGLVSCPKNARLLNRPQGFLVDSGAGKKQYYQWCLNFVFQQPNALVLTDAESMKGMGLKFHNPVVLIGGQIKKLPGNTSILRPLLSMFTKDLGLYKHADTIVYSAISTAEHNAALFPALKEKSVCIPWPVSIKNEQTDKTYGDIIKVYCVIDTDSVSQFSLLSEIVRRLNVEGYSNRLKIYIDISGVEKVKTDELLKYSNTKVCSTDGDLKLTKDTSSFDLFLNLSISSAIPAALQQAMAEGIPVVMSENGPGSEYVPNNAAFKVEAGSARAFKWAVQQFYQMEPEERRKMAIESFNAAQIYFSGENIAGAYLDVFKGVRRR